MQVCMLIPEVVFARLNKRCGRDGGRRGNDKSRRIGRSRRRDEGRATHAGRSAARPYGLRASIIAAEIRRRERSASGSRRRALGQGGRIATRFGHETFHVKPHAERTVQCKILLSDSAPKTSAPKKVDCDRSAAAPDSSPSRKAHGGSSREKGEENLRRTFVVASSREFHEF
ncbi:hypothetical protein EVAR_25308_1 [Eumeta japonica]|uniref:Uncharacterized protein n=1 Tax=Eumeta variegata TaxID=151549 RepID=A0A4C1VRL9_EUMVA|nr:hypothetical protein EVAR_25308_1 [Eumeta japonica]